jgi:phasin family protein
MAKDMKKDATMENSNPFGDLTKMLEQFKVPGVDMSSIIDARRKDIEALVEANKAAYEAMQALARKQTDMLTQAMQGIQEAAKGMANGGVGVAEPAKQAEVARNACQKVLADMKDLAEMARKSQADTVASMTRRATQNMQEIKQMMLAP